MLRLTMIIYALTGPTLAGILMVAMLASGLDTLQPILVSVAIGFVAAMPVAWLIARRILEMRR